MDLQLIIDTIKKQLPEDTHEFCDYKQWKIYSTLSGDYEGNYFDLYFRETWSGRKTIEIAGQTDQPLVFVEMIKKIDKKAIITYTKIVRVSKNKPLPPPPPKDREIHISGESRHKR